MNKNNFQKGEIIIYKTSKNEVDLDVRLEEETVWLNLNQIARLFDTNKSGISRHIKNVYQSGELDKKATVVFLIILKNKIIRLFCSSIISGRIFYNKLGKIVFVL